MEIADGLLYVEVLGGGIIGESIIIRLPGGQWGVVDCYSSHLNKPDKHPVIQRLKYLNVPELEFVALTHPHEDHYRGMRLLLEEYPPKRFWMFAGTTPHLLEYLIQYLPAEADAGRTNSSRSSIDDLIRTFEIVSERAKAVQIIRTFVSGISQVVSTGVCVESETFPLKITSFAPHGNVVNDYETKLATCFDPSSVIEKLTDVPLDHNDLSIGFVIEFGQCRVILGGDVVRKTWELVLRPDPMNPMELAATAVKVSHHGSATGYCDSLWSTFAREKKPLAIVTPWRLKLPSAEAIEHILEYSDSLVATGLRSGAEALQSGFNLTTAFSPEAIEHLRADAITLPQPLGFGRCGVTLNHLGRVINVEIADGAGHLTASPSQGEAGLSA